ncbi:MAG: class I SAM-dependent DNA methyltransferase [Sphingopyxis sp.]|nr:class I SAM-dependent DNA methyltransferase [Sphingopyxis sp.]
MRDALAQAKRYAVNLPGDHPWPPFLIVCDVGRAFELYFDWSGNGRGYGYFPDQQSYRIDLHSLTSDQPVKGVDKTSAEILMAIWTNPASVDPRAKSAEVSREIAKRLADVSKWLEETQKQRTTDALDRDRSLAIEETALFLMRVIFCMFAEDVGLLPKRSFTEFLGMTLEREAAFEPELRNLWQIMGQPDGERYASAVGAEVRYFNGGLFESAKTYSLSLADRGELYEAAKADWTKVEPAIFGTLLEQALTATERAKLGAHYTPRAYVERLVQATIMDVLDAEWDAILHPPRDGEGDRKGVEGAIDLEQVQAFHARVSSLRILDPACGTGNFLYVAMENLMRLESDVVETIRQLGGRADPKVGPHQFLGLELNARAAVIAELVLWIGWLRWRMKNDPNAAPDPVLRRENNINFGTHGGYDAVLRRTITGEPDIDNPMQPEWPEADFIIGNPPFIGGKDIRRNLGGDHAEALWKANPRVPKSADFVMQWWDRAAHALVAPQSPLIRFGFVTTNSITQTFSRRVIENYLHEMSPSPEGEVRARLSLILAIPDHPWTKATKDAAAVRIAMTVAERGEREGQLVEIVSESGLDTDAPSLIEAEETGSIHADLKVGADTGAVVPLKANEGLGYRGVQLIGSGFIVSPSQATHLGLGKREGLEKHIRPYRNGRDLLQRARGVLVIDLLGLDEREVRQKFPEVYQYVYDHVYAKKWNQEANKGKGEWEGREVNRRPSYKKFWWLHGEPRKDLRPALLGQHRFIATVETARHRIFQFVDVTVLPDNKIIVLCSSDAAVLGVLCSEIHQQWTFARCGLIGMANFEAGHVYVKSDCFDPFPFPVATPEQRATIADLA